MSLRQFTILGLFFSLFISVPYAMFHGEHWAGPQWLGNIIALSALVPLFAFYLLTYIFPMLIWLFLGATLLYLIFSVGEEKKKEY